MSGLWTDGAVVRLTQLWNEGKSASEIAETLGNGITRNAVIGKAHRIGLKGRPSPIIRGEGCSIHQLTDRNCRWPFGHPGSPGFYFCGKKVVPGGSYCEPHKQQSLDQVALERDRKRRREKAGEYFAQTFS